MRIMFRTLSQLACSASAEIPQTIDKSVTNGNEGCEKLDLQARDVLNSPPRMSLLENGGFLLTAMMSPRRRCFTPLRNIPHCNGREPRLRSVRSHQPWPSKT